MRCTKVDQTLAETYVRKAIAGGVMTSNDDTAYLEHNESVSGAYNGHTVGFHAAEVVPRNANGTGYGKVSATFVNMLRNNHDPRSPFYITLWRGNVFNVTDEAREEWSKTEIQVGLPTGYNEALIRTLPGFEDFVAPTSYTRISEPNLNTVGSRAAPSMLMRYSQTELLLAEAALRGWTNGTTPKEHYEKGVRASMSVQNIYPGGYVIKEEDIVNYLAGTGGDGTQGMPWDAAAGDFERGMELIHTQFYLSNFPNAHESFANWRRVEYPVLIPTNYPGNVTGGTIPRRLPYMDTEATLNKENYDEAIRNQGPNLWTVRVWWDKL